MLTKTAMRKAVAQAMQATGGIASWCSRKTGGDSVYDPVTGEYTSDAGTTEHFTGIVGTYTTMQRLAGIEAGSVPLYVEAAKVKSKPNVGDIVSVDGIDHDVLNVEDVQGALYILQVRRK